MPLVDMEETVIREDCLKRDGVEEIHSESRGSAS